MSVSKAISEVSEREAEATKTMDSNTSPGLVSKTR